MNKMHPSKYIQYGCGHSAPDQWRNFDASPTLIFERLPIIGKLYTKNASRFPANVEFGDIVRGLPVPDGSCRGIYCSHVLEHLSLADFRLAIFNTYKALENGGIFRLVLPDLEYLIKNYLDNSSSRASIEFLQEAALGHEFRQRGLKGIIFACLGNSQHLWMWDYKSIFLELKRVGFENIRRANFNDSSDSMFKAVEDQVRWENCLGVECQKPFTTG